MKTLRIWAGVLMLLPVLCTTSRAEETLEFDCPEKPPEEVVINNPEEVWLDGTVCFKGGYKTNVRHAYEFANAHGLEFSYSNQDYWDRVKSGELVHLKPSPDFPLIVLTVRAYVLPSTADLIRDLAIRFNETDCGKLSVTSAGRSEYDNAGGSEYSVHPAGMAVDLRTRGLGSCFQTLEALLYAVEADLLSDVTEETGEPHFHVVVIPRELPEEEPVLVADATSATTHGGQGE